jgi:hypothetical protein
MGEMITSIILVLSFSFKKGFQRIKIFFVKLKRTVKPDKIWVYTLLGAYAKIAYTIQLMQAELNCMRNMPTYKNYEN